MSYTYDHIYVHNCTNDTWKNLSTRGSIRCEDASIRRMKDTVTLVTTVVNLVLAAGIVCGNGLVLAAYTRYKFVRTVHNTLLLQMSMADLMTAPAIVLANVLTTFYLHHETTRELCVFTAWLFTMCFQAQIWMLVLVTVNRWVSIRYPLRHHVMFTWRKAAGISALVWAFLFSMDTGCMVHHVWAPGVKCYPFRVVNPVCFKVLVYPLILLPLLAMPVLYALLLRFAYIHNKQMKNHVRTPGDDKLRSRTREVKTLRTLGTILGILYVSWLPTFVLSYVMTIEPRSYPAAVAQKLYRDVATTCLYLGSLFNPLVYHRSSATFRRAFLLLLSRPSEAISSQGCLKGGMHLVTRTPTSRNVCNHDNGGIRHQDDQVDSNNGSDQSKLTEISYDSSNL